MTLTQERLKELLDYDPETGVFRWKQKRGGRPAGSVAGCYRRAYVAISIDDKIYRAHHLAWLWMTGRFPVGFLDHKNINKHCNAWLNLREATKSQNGANRPAQANSKSGLKGAYYYAPNKKWQSTIQKDGRTIYLGYFETAKDAHAAYCEAAERLYGEFARPS